MLKCRRLFCHMFIYQRTVIYVSGSQSGRFCDKVVIRVAKTARFQALKNVDIVYFSFRMKIQIIIQKHFSELWSWRVSKTNFPITSSRKTLRHRLLSMRQLQLRSAVAILRFVRRLRRRQRRKKLPWVFTYCYVKKDDQDTNDGTNFMCLAICWAYALKSSGLVFYSAVIGSHKFRPVVLMISLVKVIHTCQDQT